IGEQGGQLGGQILDFLLEQAVKVPENEVWIGSSEVLESLYGKLKYLEQDQSRSGFTSLVLGVTACLGQLNTEIVTQALTITKGQDVIDWERDNLGVSLQAKRRQALRKSKCCRPLLTETSGQEYGGFLEEISTGTD